MRDQTGYYRTTALPTPPSDAGTSEREMVCASCGKPLAEHGAPHAWDTLRLPSCPPPSATGTYRAAAPAAEGPRADWKCTNIRSHFADEWMCGTLNGADEESCGACGADRPVAALPVAEAGTPETTAFPDDAEWLVYLDRFVEQTNPQSLPRSIHDRLRAVAAALTSEVRALREDKARLDAIESGEVEIECMGTTVPYQWAHGPGGDHVAIRLDRNPKTLREAIDAARLASPSPTGAP